jgi:hypothetical protein
MISIFSHLLGERGIQTQKYFLESIASGRLSSPEFDVVVLDLDHVGGCTEIAKSLPRPNKHLIVAVASDSRAKEVASAVGAAFIVERPLIQSQIKELLGRVHGRMLHDRRGYFRLAVELPVSIRRRASGDLVQSTTINLSQSGMAITTPRPLDVGEQLSIEFAIPKSELLLSAEGTVIWSDKQGKAGIHCEYTNSPVKARFLDWLRDHFFMQFDRMETELSLAHGIQAALVPPLSFRTRSFEVYGKSIASKVMGGDLIDVVESDGSLLAYVADVSGHGLAAGQLMGMLKATMRVSLQFHQRPVALLEGADRVLPALKVRTCTPLLPCCISTVRAKPNTP